MTRYILKRVLSAIITIWFIMTITFILMHSIPGDPFASEKAKNPIIKQALDAKYGFDKPYIVQYAIYLKNFIKGDFGVSFQKKGYTADQVIMAGFPTTATIGIIASVMVMVFGISAGIIAAIKQNRIFDRAAMIFATLGATVPSFVIATAYLFLFSKVLGWVPSFGVSSWKGFIGPAIAIGVFQLSYVTRLTRSSMLDVMQQDYIRTARAKGLSEVVVIGKHGLKNALIPIVTYIGPMIANVITGSFVAETVFGVPGIGQLFTTSIQSRDYTLIMGITVFFAILLVAFVLVVDLIYVLIDPRIKFE